MIFEEHLSVVASKYSICEMLETENNTWELKLYV